MPGSGSGYSNDDCTPINATPQDGDTGSQLPAASISYDNTVSSLNAAHVQAAIDLIWDLAEGPQGEPGKDGEIPKVSIKTADFTVDPADGFDHYYAVTAASVNITIPTGLVQGYRFSVRCMADTVFVTTGVTINIPSSQELVPFEQGAVIGFTVIDTDSVDAFGDMNFV